MFHSLSDKQLDRLWNRILQRIRDFGRGGDLFGVDARTLQICKPGLYDAYQQVRIELRARYYQDGAGI